ncbi:MAG: oligosaccharide flippase family protein [Candidatus Ozemobacteraceae bacterium]
MSLKSNILANYLGQGWTALMGIAFVPIYIKYLGLEAYGLIGALITLQALFSLLDMGMTPTLQREMARFSGGAHTPQSIRELLHSIEVICVGFSFLIAISVWSVSGWLAQNWFHAEHLSVTTIEEAIATIGLIIALRFVEGIYRGTLLGLQTHVWLNGASSIFSTLRGVGAIIILAWFSPTIKAFFLWQACISFATVVTFAVRVHHSLPPALQPVHFSRLALLNIWGFAKGMIATTLLTLLLTQLDRILLSRFLSLEAFGTYSFAAAVANSLLNIIGPIAQGYYPHFTELLTRNDEPGLIAAYHKGSQLMTVILIPATLMLIFHSETILTIWSRNPGLAKAAAPLIAVIAMGTALNGLMTIPYMLQLAYGLSSFMAKVNVIAVVILIPIQLWAISRFGTFGAAWVWVTLNANYIFVVIPIMHRRLLPKEKWIWYRRDFIFPTLSAFLMGLFLTFAFPITGRTLFSVLGLISYGLAMTVAAAFAASDLRNFVFAKFRKMRTESL